MVPFSYENISFSRNEKEARKEKESCLCKGRFQYSCILLRFENTLRLMPWVPLPQENPFVQEPPPTTKGTTQYSDQWASWKYRGKNQAGHMGVSILHITISGKFKRRSCPPRRHHPFYIIKGKNLQNGANVGLNKDLLVLFLFLSSYLDLPNLF